MGRQWLNNGIWATGVSGGRREGECEKEYLCTDTTSSTAGCSLYVFLVHIYAHPIATGEKTEG